MRICGFFKCFYVYSVTLQLCRQVLLHFLSFFTQLCRSFPSSLKHCLTLSVCVAFFQDRDQDGHADVDPAGDEERRRRSGVDGRRDPLRPHQLPLRPLPRRQHREAPLRRPTQEDGPGRGQLHAQLVQDIWAGNFHFQKSVIKTWSWSTLKSQGTYTHVMCGDSESRRGNGITSLAARATFCIPTR